MEIRYLTEQEKQASRALYEEIFVEDEKAFVDAYYKIKASDNQILGVFEEGRLVSMLHRNPYRFRLRGELVRADYLVAVATRVAFRHRGMMRALLRRALSDMRAERMPFTFLMPADEAIYTPFDFRLMGNEDEEGLASLDAARLSEDYELYAEKDALYEKQHISWPEWERTPMMLRLLHLPSFVSRIGATEPQSLCLRITDEILPENDGVFCWKFTEEGSRLTPAEEEAGFTVSVADLGSFLVGMLGPEELLQACPSKQREAFLEKLLNIRVLNGIYINETV